MTHYLEGGDVRLETVAQQRTREGGDVRLDQAADRMRLEPWQLRDDPGARLTALDTFSTGRVEGTSGTNAITPSNDLVTTDPSNAGTTPWGETVTRVGDIEGGVEPGTPVTERDLPNVDLSGAGIGDELGKIGIFIAVLVAFVLAAQAFAKGLGQGVAS